MTATAHDLKNISGAAVAAMLQACVYAHGSHSILLRVVYHKRSLLLSLEFFFFRNV